ncbi:MAG: MFS transporter [Coriobacteriales bacterium]|jgi:MFS family permease|nr:MFS transporter [Coriobacteriales bacterium]
MRSTESQLPATERQETSRPPLWTREYLLVCLISLFGATNAYLLMVVIAAYSVDVFHTDSAAAGTAASIFIIGALISRIFAGKMLGLLGYKSALAIGVASNAFFSLCYIFVPSIEMLVVVRLLHGVSFGIITTTAPAIAADIVPTSRAGEGMGYFGLSATIATGVGPFLAMLLSEAGNYVMIFVLCAVLMFAGLVLCPLLRIKKLELSAEDKTKLSGFKLTSIIEAPVVPIAFVALLLYFCYGGVVSFIALFMRELDLVEFASLFFVVFAVVVFASRPLVGRIFDARGIRVIVIPALLCTALGLLLFSQSQNHWMLLASAVVIGLGVGAVQGATLAQVAKVTPPARRGVASSTYSLLIDVGYSLGPLLIGIFVPYLGFRGVFLALSLVTLLNFVCFVCYSRQSTRPSS